MSKVYPVGLVGESKYQHAIRSCTPGERVYVCHELGNPYDDNALLVETSGGQVIGYIARKSWLRDAIHEQGRGVTATILSIAMADGGDLGVVLNVTLTDDDIRLRDYDGRPPERIAYTHVGRSRPNPIAATLSRLFRR